MRVLGNELFDDSGRKLAAFSAHWPAVAAMIVCGKPVDETKWPFRGLRQDDIETMRALSAPQPI